MEVFQRGTSVIAFTFWIMQAVSAAQLARIIIQLVRDMKKCSEDVAPRTRIHSRVYAIRARRREEKGERERELLVAISSWIF